MISSSEAVEIVKSVLATLNKSTNLALKVDSGGVLINDPWIFVRIDIEEELMGGKNRYRYYDILDAIETELERTHPEIIITTAGALV